MIKNGNVHALLIKQVEAELVINLKAHFPQSIMQTEDVLFSFGECSHISHEYPLPFPSSSFSCIDAETQFWLKFDSFVAS